MKLTIFAAIFVTFAILKPKVVSQFLTCEYSYSTFLIPETDISISYYACTFKTNRRTFVQSGTRPTWISGSHPLGKSDSDVKFLKNYPNDLLNTFTSIFCRKFPNLEAIVAGRSLKLEFVDVDSFRNCRNLKHLQLFGHNFDSLPEHLLIANTKIETLFVSQNSRLRSLPDYFLSRQSDLKYLTLHSNQLESLPDNFFSKLYNLRMVLFISQNNLEVINPKVNFLNFQKSL